MSHTPGPWQALLHSDTEFVPEVRGICSMYWGIHEPTPESEAAMVAQVEANARLIAAAPDLLEACKALLADYIETCEEHNIQVFRASLALAREAIAKAEKNPDSGLFHP